MTNKHKIGFIGLGIMGRGMAANLIKAGYEVAVYNRTRSETKPFAEKGCGVAYTPKQLASYCDTLIIMVSDPVAVDAVTEGPDGAFSGLIPGKTMINMSTVSPEYTKKLAGKCLISGINFLDCPVSGSKPLAETGNLVILAAGKEDCVKRNEEILRAMGLAVIYAGEVPNATYLKLCVNLVMGQLTTAIAEAAHLAEACKIDPALIFQVLDTNPALQCKYFNMKRDSILNKKFPPVFPLKHMLKDARFVMSTAEQKKVNLPVTKTMLELYEKSAKLNHGDEDISAVYMGLDQIKTPENN